MAAETRACVCTMGGHLTPAHFCRLCQGTGLAPAEAFPPDAPAPPWHGEVLRFAYTTSSRRVGARLARFLDLFELDDAPEPSVTAPARSEISLAWTRADRALVVTIPARGLARAEKRRILRWGDEVEVGPIAIDVVRRWLRWVETGSER